MMGLLDAALDAAGRGWSVIPVCIKSKHPATAWKCYQTRRATPAEISAWWGRTPDLNLGIVTGRISGLTVLDLDPRNSPDGETVAYVTKLLPPPTVITPNGWHWYMKDAGLPTIPRLLPGLDLKGQGGYILAPPSIHPSGKPYERLSDRVIPVPAEVLALAEKRVNNHTRNGRKSHGGDTALGEALTLADVLGLLHGVRPHRGGYLACCPAHDDQHPSLSVGESATGRLLAKCFAGCAFPAIMRELWTRYRDRQLAESIR